ncbi:hypothetical protein BpHYR1_048477 [Brachionus plicatilis]|uniref:Uncharacterized protein n=1 Tax=Brachionus plicatilis TaxID=10195 RepID=A0A3M7QBR4_BRAPC|nr:hypothetical protein BpHYR1_048477 [Brachionus plicatilis]
MVFNHFFTKNLRIIRLIRLWCCSVPFFSYFFKPTDDIRYGLKLILQMIQSVTRSVIPDTHAFYCITFVAACELFEL